MIKRVKSYGVVKINDKWINAILDFMDNGTPLITIFYGRLSQPEDIMLGRFNGIGNVTLLRNYNQGWTAGAGAATTLIRSMVIINGHYLTDQDLCFNSCSIDISPYSNWFKESVLDDYQSTSITFSDPVDLFTHNIHNIDFKINLNKNIRNYREDGTTKIFVELKSHLFLTSNELIPAAQFFSIRNEVITLFTFFSSNRYFLMPYCFQNLPWNDTTQPFYVYEKPFLFPHNRLRYKTISYHAIREHFSNILDRAYSNREIFTVINRAISRYNHDNFDYIDGFLNLNFAIEYYYSIHKGEKDLRGAYLDKLVHLNSLVSPKKKLEEDFLISVKDTRDFYVHAKEKKPTVLDDLEDTTEQLDRWLRDVIISDFFGLDISY